MKSEFSNPLLNPQKLMPPCLTKQVQGMVDEFALTLGNLHVHAQPQMKNLGPSYLDEFKLKLQREEDNEVACISQVLNHHWLLPTD